MAAERAINLLNVGFTILTGAFVLAMNPDPAEVPAAHRAGGRVCSPAERRTAQRIDIAPHGFDYIDMVLIRVLGATSDLLEQLQYLSTPRRSMLY